MDDGIDAVEVGDPVVVQDRQVRLDDLGIVLPGVLVDQDQVIDVGPGGSELAADVAAGAGDQNGPGLRLDLLGEQIVIEPSLPFVSIVVVLDVVVLDVVEAMASGSASASSGS